MSTHDVSIAGGSCHTLLKIRNLLLRPPTTASHPTLNDPLNRWNDAEAKQQRTPMQRTDSGLDLNAVGDS
jgi:hypothetical protein